VEIEFAGWDGPSLAEIELTVCTLAAQCDIAVVTFPVINVAPEVSIVTAIDELGNTIGVDLPGVLAGLRLDIQGTFTDAGAFDTHTAAVEWGDGNLDNLGGVATSVSAGHVYMAAGERTITLTVTDDDGGVGAATRQITVLDGTATAEIAIASLEGILTGLHPGGPAAQAMRKALAELEGNAHYKEPSGVRELLQGGAVSAALEKIRQALSYLDLAESLAAGLDLAAPKKLLAMTAKSAAAVEIDQADPNPIVFAEVEKLMSDGDSLLVAGDYSGAVGKYHKASIMVQVFPEL
jgi:hypothetical protein